MNVANTTSPCRRQCSSPSHTDARDSFTPYRKNSSTTAAFVSQENSSAPAPLHGSSRPSSTASTMPVVKRSSLLRKPGMAASYPYLRSGNS